MMTKCMKLSVGALISLVLFIAGNSLKAADKVPATDDGAEIKMLQVMVTPTTPYLLPDGQTRIVVKKEAISLGRAGRTGTVQVLLGESALTVVPQTVIHVGG